MVLESMGWREDRAEPGTVCKLGLVGSHALLWVQCCRLIVVFYTNKKQTHTEEVTGHQWMRQSLGSPLSWGPIWTEVVMGTATQRSRHQYGFASELAQSMGQVSLVLSIPILPQ